MFQIYPSFMPHYFSYRRFRVYLYLTRLCVCVCVCAQLCSTFCNPMNCRPLGSTVHGIFQTRILEWVAISFSRGSSWPRDQTQGSCVSCIGRKILYQPYHLGSPINKVISPHWIFPAPQVPTYACVFTFPCKLPHGPAIPLLGMHTEETRTERDVCSSPQCSSPHCLQ